MTYQIAFCMLRKRIEKIVAGIMDLECDSDGASIDEGRLIVSWADQGRPHEQETIGGGAELSRVRMVTSHGEGVGRRGRELGREGIYGELGICAGSAQSDALEKSNTENEEGSMVQGVLELLLPHGERRRAQE